MADTPVLGTGLARGEGSSPFSPTRNGSRVILVQKRVYQFRHRPTNLVVLYMIETICPTTIIVNYINFTL